MSFPHPIPTEVSSQVERCVKDVVYGWSTFKALKASSCITMPDLRKITSFAITLLVLLPRSQPIENFKVGGMFKFWYVTNDHVSDSSVYKSTL